MSRTGAGILPIVIGTAGHIDHGKSSLVTSLTGIDPDRLKEEKERGMTIDLGFANLLMPDGRRVGIVDVPGHERFVRNMVAGATGIDLALLVVAADDGVMPQTREHVEILDLLGVTRCIVVLTKVDLVDLDMQELVEEDVRLLLAGTSLTTVSTVRVSNTTKRGIEALKLAIGEAVLQVSARSSEGVFRMPVQRVFTRPGFGTVVTGIPVAGTVAIGDLLEVQPGGARGRVRGLHAYGSVIDRACAGHSTAINLTDVQVHEVARGDLLAPPGMVTAGTRFEGKLRLLASAEPLRHLTRVRFHVGTKEVLGRVSLLDRDVLPPGEEGLVQVLTKERVVACLGDRFLLRLETPPRSIGGGVVLSVSRRREKRFREEVLARLRAVDSSAGDLEGLAVEAVRAAGTKGLSVDEAEKGLQRPRDEVKCVLERLAAREQVVPLPRGDRYVHARTLDDAGRALDAAFRAHFEERPLARHATRLRLREKSGIQPDVLDVVLALRERRGEIVQGPTSCFAPKGRDAALAPADAADLVKLVSAAAAAGQSPRTREEAALAAGLTPARVERLLQRAFDDGAIIELGHEFLYAREHLEAARAAVVANCNRNGKELVIPELRDTLGTTRKYLIPILEHFDAVGLTRRRGNLRVLA